MVFGVAWLVVLLRMGAAVGLLLVWDAFAVAYMITGWLAAAVSTHRSI
ncbi:hypothetical protein SAMN05421837_102746 [Amycolatopsis pretoriensis]|uniref:Uncharacterized protein n=1 Tax=Amycolatopsis pretoriensis TaxID=218821 RepID=A0A1H5QET9_9PSEU|nr:hypothetical protein [Amycolatopsis pretoriensis]SEF24509.1 hypothetical protein SAMN05421837_102746 [Amycolatopsis pretoriensis]